MTADTVLTFSGVTPGVVPQCVPNQSNALALELMDTWSCVDMLSQLEAFENAVFGPDFVVPVETTRGWAQSGSWFCAAVIGQAVVGRQQIFSMLSILVTSEQCRDRLLEGSLHEAQLEPWTYNPRGPSPSLYLASVISAASDHLALMYETLAGELRAFRAAWATEFRSGFCIASGAAGFSHMARNGFRSVEGRSYRGHYPLMLVDAQTAATPFWHELLGTKPSSTTAMQNSTKSSQLSAVALAS